MFGLLLVKLEIRVIRPYRVCREVEGREECWLDLFADRALATPLFYHLGLGLASLTYHADVRPAGRTSGVHLDRRRKPIRLRAAQNGRLRSHQRSPPSSPGVGASVIR